MSISEMADWLSASLGWEVRETTRRLQVEAACSGFNVVEDFVSNGLHAFEWSAGLEEFYARTRAFVFELLIYNSHPDRLQLRRTTLELLRSERERKKRPISVLFWGDGLGFDSLAAALTDPNNDVTYFEVGEFSTRFARFLFDAHGVVDRLHIAVSPDEIRGRHYDAVVSIDVLEHLPDPVAWIVDARDLLDGQGVAIVKEAFDAIIPARPTHLRSNAAHAYRTPELFNRNGFGCERYGNFPYVFRKGRPFTPHWRQRLYHVLTAPVKRRLIRSRLTEPPDLIGFLRQCHETIAAA